MHKRTIGKSTEYEYLDSGEGVKLERWGMYTLVRPAPQALWHKRLTQTEWEACDAIFERTDKMSGTWHVRTELPETWRVTWHSFSFIIKPTTFGHVGLFPEQLINWEWVQEQIHSSSIPIQLLNMFGYTGGLSISAVAAGASICHLDASKASVDWARQNAEINHLEHAPIRWIVDDVFKFVKREQKRGHRYNAIVLDPPSFGRGTQGQVWKMERDLQILMDLCMQILTDSPRFVIISSHTPGYSAHALSNLLIELKERFGGVITCNDMTISNKRTCVLPSGYYARWNAP